jgi:hypothetical protein
LRLRTPRPRHNHRYHRHRRRLRKATLINLTCDIHCHPHQRMYGHLHVDHSDLVFTKRSWSVRLRRWRSPTPSPRPPHLHCCILLTRNVHFVTYPLHFLTRT